MYVKKTLYSLNGDITRRVGIKQHLELWVPGARTLTLYVTLWNRLYYSKTNELQIQILVLHTIVVDDDTLTLQLN